MELLVAPVDAPRIWDEVVRRGARPAGLAARDTLRLEADSAVFPGQQGGPLEHAIAGKAVALKIAMSELFRERQQRTLDGARAIAQQLLKGAQDGIGVVSGGTDVHLVLADLRASELDGQQAEDRLDAIGITANRNAVPFDPRPPMVASGVRIGTPALATRGLQVADFAELGDVIRVAFGPQFEARQGELRARCAEIADRYPLYEHLGTAAAV